MRTAFYRQISPNRYFFYDLQATSSDNHLQNSVVPFNEIDRSEAILMQAIKRGALAGLLVFALVAVATAQNTIPWARDIQQAKQIAAQQNKLVMVHFWSPQCGPCLALEKYVFRNPQMARAVAANFVPVKVNAAQRPDLADMFQVTRWPTDVYITPGGSEIFRQVSPSNANNYVTLLDRVAQKNQRSQPQRGLNELAQAARNSRNSYAGGQFEPRGYQSGPNPRSNNVDSYNNRPSPYDSRVRQHQDPRYRDQQYQDLQYQDRNNSNPPMNRNSRVNDNWQPAPTNGPYADQYPRNGAFQGTPVHDNQNRDDRRGYDSRNKDGYFPGDNQRQNNPPPRYDDRTPRGEIRDNEFYGNHPQNTDPRENSAGNNRRPATSPPTIAAGNPTLALDGFCVVSLQEKSKWLPADKRWGAIHRGRTYLFVGQFEQQKFLDDPDKYAPMLSGYDPVRFFEDRKVVAGKREFGVFLKNKRLGHSQIFLFSDQKSMQAFEAAPGNYVGKVYEAMRLNAMGRMRR